MLTVSVSRNLKFDKLLGNPPTLGHNYFAVPYIIAK